MAGAGVEVTVAEAIPLLDPSMSGYEEIPALYCKILATRWRNI
jgi:hypothetical protein